MKHILTYITMVVLFATVAQHAHAAEKTAGSSAVLFAEAPVQSQQTEDKRAEILKAYLERYSSPLAEHAQTFIDEADKYGLDWKLVAAIAGVESYFGQMVPGYSYNGWGFGIYGNNMLRFASWDEGIETVTQSIRERYMNERGATNIYEIGATYAEDRSWAYKVQRFMNEIEAFESATRNNTLSISI